MQTDISDIAGLNQEEHEVMVGLLQAWIAFLELPDLRPDDTSDFRQAIHTCQRLLAIRIVRRAYPEFWGVRATEVGANETQ